MTIDGKRRHRRRTALAVTSRPLVAAALLAVTLLAASAPPAGAAAPPVAWTALRTTVAPPPRQGAAMAYDASSGQLVLFGGRSGSGALLGDTWVFANGTWTEACASNCGPQPATGASIAFDTKLDQLVLFGGQTALNPSRFSNATWTWNGRQWYRPPTAALGAPPGRAGAAMAADDSGPHGSIVLFGGTGVEPNPAGALSGVAGTVGMSTTALSDTWTWDGSGWSQQLPAQSPPARTGAAATWDPRAGAVVLFGGSPGGLGGWLGDTWFWHTDTWTALPLATPPSPRGGASLAYQPTLGNVVLFGGQSATGATDDTWTVSGLSWVPVLTETSPAPRSGAAASTDSANGSIMLFGGIGPGGVVYGDTEMLASPQTTSPTSSTVPASSTSSTSSTSTSTVPGTPAALGPAPTTRPPGGASTTAPQGMGALGGGASLSVTSQRVRTGEQVVVSGSGFAPAATVTVTFHSTPAGVVGRAQADALGAFSAAVTVPRDASRGLHHFEAIGPTADGGSKTLETPVLVTGSGAGHRSPPGYEVGAMVGLAVLFPLATWLILDMVGRARRHRSV